MRKRTVVTAGTMLVVGLGLASAHAQVVQPQMVCGLEVYPSPTAIPDPGPAPTPRGGIGIASALTGDPCTEGESIFGPRRFEKGRGLAKWEYDNFTVEGGANAEVCIRSSSSGFMDPRKAWPFVALDRTIIVNPWDLKDLLDEQIHELAPGSHELGAYVVGLRGAYVDVEVLRMADGGGGGGGEDPNLPAPGETRIDPETGAVDMVSADGRVRLQNVAADHPLLTPNGDGKHDGTAFQALTTPLIALPGKDAGTTDYFLSWQFNVTDLQSCNAIDAGLVGTEQINSPTLATVEWDGTDVSGTLLPEGNYAYSFDVNVVDEFGADFGRITSPAFGIVIGSITPTDTLEMPEQLGTCNPATDPEFCKCPDTDGVPGTLDPNHCSFAFGDDLLSEATFPFGFGPSYYQHHSPSAFDLSFITTTQDPVSGRYRVTVDMRKSDVSGNGDGLVPKGQISFFPSPNAFRQWVADMTGVPLGTGDSLFNFDYVQIGVATGVDLFGLALRHFNHFLLDASTDFFGRLNLDFSGTSSTDIWGGFNDDTAASASYALTNPRTGDECTEGGNSDGMHSVRAKFCAYNIAVPISGTNFGIYGLRTTTFDIQLDATQTRQDSHCVIDGLFVCGVRTRAVTADSIEIESEYFTQEGGLEPELERTESIQANGANGLSTMVDRSDGGLDGVCSKSVATKDGLAVVMSAADGAVPDSCVINGIFF